MQIGAFSARTLSGAACSLADRPKYAKLGPLNGRRTLGQPHLLDVGHVNLRPSFCWPGEGLSNRLSDFDLNQFFLLTAADIKAVGAQFRPDHRAPAALMVLYLRAVGRPLDSSTVLPRNLPRYVRRDLQDDCAHDRQPALDLSAQPDAVHTPALGETHLGLKDLDEQSEAQLVALLAAGRRSLPLRRPRHCGMPLAVRAPHPGSPVRGVCRTARAAFAATEAEILQTISKSRAGGHAQELPRVNLVSALDGTATHLEWLKTPSRRHGLTSLILEKIR